MKIGFVLIIFSLLLIGISSCIQAPDYPIEPVITYQGLSKNTMKQAKIKGDSLRVIFSFTDGDGDIGSIESNGIDIVLIDKRTNVIYGQFRAPTVPEKGTKNGIDGTAEVVIFSTCCVYPDSTPPCEVNEDYPLDSLKLEIYMTDRAGHESNHIETEWIYLECDKI